jgi:UDP-N-acetyl-D-galactosamine dehydrogenase
VTLDALVFAVPHKWYLDDAHLGAARLVSMVRSGGVLVDVKSALDPAAASRTVRYSSL